MSALAEAVARRPAGKERRQFTRLRALAGRAIRDYRMIEADDRVMVCLSGGKDSYVMLDVLIALRARSPVPFDLFAVNLDQKQPGFPAHVLPDYLDSVGVGYEIIEQDTYSVVKRVLAEGKTMCSLCSRLRRGALYSYARDRGFDKLALGHHREDIVETLFMNMFHGRRLKAMPPKLLSEDGNCVVIRPLAYCPENEIENLAGLRGYPIIPCNLCGSQDHLERVRVKEMLKGWERESPGRTEAIFRSIQHISPSQLADPTLFDFASLNRRAKR